MTELDAVRQVGGDALPPTCRTIAADLRALGVPEGGVVLVHSSLRALGWVVGGPEAVVEALLTVLGPDGTLVVPSFSTARTEPSHWENPPVPEPWWPVIRAESPAFDPKVSSTREMGAIVDCVLRWPGVRRSAHPHYSFAAIGPLAERVLEPHPLPYGLGEESPLAHLYDLDAHVLLLGVGHGNNTSLHLAEHRAAFPGKRTRQQGAAVLVDGRRQWATFPDLDTSDEDFVAVGAAFEETGGASVGPAGAGTARLMRQRPLVDFGTGEIGRRRTT